MQPFKPQASISTRDREHGHENRDVNPSGVYAFLIFLTVGGVFIFVLLGGVYKYANRYAEEQDRKIEEQSPWLKQEAEAERQDAKKMAEGYRAAGKTPTYKELRQREAELRIERFRQPRLQSDDVHDMEMLREAEDVRLNNYLWLDKNAGKISIPIQQAMQLVVQQQPQEPGTALVPGLGDAEALQEVPQMAPMIPSSTGITRPSIESSHSKLIGGKR